MERSNSINLRQFVFVCVLVLLAMRVIIEPSILYIASGKDGYISYIFALAINLIGILICCFIITKYPGVSFSDVLKKCLGSVICKVILALLFVFFTFKIIYVDYIMQSFLTVALYEDLNWVLFIIPLYLVVGYIACKGPRVIGRLSEIFLPIGLVVLFFTIMLALKSAELQNLLPVLSNGAKPVLKGIYSGLGQMGQFLFMLIFMENLAPTSKNVTKKVMLWSGVISVVIVGFCILCTAVFGEISVTLKESIIRITQFSPVMDETFRMDGITTALWCPLVIIYQIVCTYCAGWCLKHIFNFKKIEWPVTICLLVVFVSKTIPQLSSGLTLAFGAQYFGLLSITLQLVMPLVVLIVSIRKGVKNE